ncbi:MAG: hypothetical protein WKF96_00145 [Solirubrobacteraceae bacterium]
MSLPQRNATLTAARGSSVGDSYDGPGVGPEKWAGVADAYLTEKRDRAAGAAGNTVTIDRILIVEAALGVDWRTGDQVSFAPTADGGVATIATVRGVQIGRTDDPEIPSEMRTVRLTLEPA